MILIRYIDVTRLCWKKLDRLVVWTADFSLDSLQVPPATHMILPKPFYGKPCYLATEPPRNLETKTVNLVEGGLPDTDNSLPWRAERFLRKSSVHSAVVSFRGYHCSICLELSLAFTVVFEDPLLLLIGY